MFLPAEIRLLAHVTYDGIQFRRAEIDPRFDFMTHGTIFRPKLGATFQRARLRVRVSSPVRAGQAQKTEHGQQGEIN